MVADGTEGAWETIEAYREGKDWIKVAAIMGRTLSYMFAIVRKNRSTEHPFFKYTFQGYDFQTNTNLFEKIYSRICVGSGLIALFFMGLWVVVGGIIFLQTGAWLTVNNILI